MKKIIKRKLIIQILVIAIFVIGMTVIKGNDTIKTNANLISNVKIEWGIKRNENHTQPDVGKKNKELLDKYKGICLGNNDKKYVYLTFDSGYEAGYTGKILETLKQNEVKATFFITAHYLNTQPDLVKRMIDEGHILGNHTVNHKSMPSLNEEEIKKEVMDLHQAICSKYEYDMKYIRPPKGEYSEKSLSITNSLGYKTVMWSFAYEDWDESKQPNEEKAKEKILNNLHNGEIMLLHSTSKTNANILDDLLKKIKEQGYEIRSIDEFEE